MTKALFIEKASIKHNSFYSYPHLKSTVLTLDTISITCPKHGAFDQVVKNHLRGSGCLECSKSKRWENRKKPTTVEMVKRFKKIHGNLCDYSKFEYLGDRVKSIIICPKHGEFKQTPNAHYSGNVGCPECRYKSTANKMLKNESVVLEEFKEAHGNYYDYSKVRYMGMFKKVTIICPKHGEFKQTPKGHSEGKGCKSCASHGFNPSVKAYLYYLSINDGEAYKIGITNLTINERYHIYDLKKIKVIHVEEFEIGQDAYDKEQVILKQHTKSKYSGEPLLSSGNTELFANDVLGLDNPTR